MVVVDEVFTFPFHQEATSALIVTVRGVLAKVAICQKTDDQFFLVRIVRVSIMALKSGENTMIKGLNTNIAISLPLI
jgi:hypothetical protein